MAAPAILAVTEGSEAAKVISKVLTGDLVTFNFQVYRVIRQRVPTGEKTKAGKPAMTTAEFLVPIDVEAHVNPVSIGLGLATLAGAVLFGLIAWHGLSLPGPLGPVAIFPGFKETDAGKRLAEKAGSPPPSQEKEGCLRLLALPGGVLLYAACVLQGGDPSR